MSQVDQIAGMIGALEKQLLLCNRCGMCQSVCPLFAETGREADVARGKLALLCGLMEKMFCDAGGVKARLDKCLLCGACQAHCPAGVDALELFLKARSIISRFQGLSHVKKIALKTLLSGSDTMDHLFELGTKFQKLAIKPASPLIDTYRMRIGEGLMGGRHFKLPAIHPFHRRVSAVNTPAGRSGLKVAFFTGCLIDRFYPEIAADALYVMQHYGVGVFLPENQQCCGIPALSSGDDQTFDKLMEHNLERFEQNKFDYLITACATCTFTLKKLWPAFAEKRADGSHGRVSKLASKTLDINLFINKFLPITSGKPNDTRPRKIITCHDPCHLKKSFGIEREPRVLIRSNPDYRLVEMADADRCCGMGGSFNLQYYSISSSIGRKKRDAIKATGCNVVATACPACMLQISDMLSRSGDKIKVVHPIQIHAEMLKTRSSKHNKEVSNEFSECNISKRCR